ncbi:MAG: C10 family peptidase [Bacteroidales bacterium]|nr:C10 family peptidase [Bacteroidales bacterium]
MKPRNYFFLIIFLTGFVFSVQARKVEQHEAEKAAINYYYETHNKFRGSLDYNDIVIKTIFTKQQNGEAAFYAFDFKGGGFVIVSAEDATYPIIGYAYTGKFPVNLNENPNYNSFLQSYVEQIVFARDNNIVADNFAQNIWDHLLLSSVEELNSSRDGNRNVEPLVSSMWNQDDPYNYYAPEDAAGPGGHCYAGCVATCMSQVMHYWRYPETGEGSHSYYATGYGTQSANFGATNYNWTSMKNSIDNSNPFAIAELQYHAGVSVEMNFSPNGSGASSTDVDNAMRDYFRYGNATYMEKGNYSTTNWISILQDELDLARPMYYSGFTNDWSGHAFVCDGYEGNLFHFNFGWSGSGNGFYSLYNVNGFYVDQRAVKNLYPTEPDYPYYASGQTLITEKSGSITDGSGPVEDYLDNTSASWLINPQNDQDSIKKINLTFGMLDTEENDVITIYDGESTSDPIIGTYSGNETPGGTISSSGNKMLITFETDGNGTGAGFYIEFSSSLPSFCSGMTNFTEATASFSDGSGTFNYNNGSTCMYRIEPDWANEITLYFDAFETEEDYDMVKVYDDQTLIATLSGNEIPDPIVASSGIMFITFNTNGFVTYDGWEAYYEVNNVGTDEMASISRLQIYPNPTKDILNISLNKTAEKSLEIEMFSVTGSRVHQEAIESGSGIFDISIDVSDLPKGMYIVRLHDGEESVHKRIIIE